MNSSSYSAAPAADAAVAPQAETSSVTPLEQPLLAVDSVIFRDVQVALQAKLGRTTMTVEELLALRAGSVVRLEEKLNGLVELRLNQALIARGEVVAVDDHFGVRIVEIATAS